MPGKIQCPVPLAEVYTISEFQSDLGERLDNPNLSLSFWLFLCHFYSKLVCEAKRFGVKNVTNVNVNGRISEVEVCCACGTRITMVFCAEEYTEYAENGKEYASRIEFRSTDEASVNRLLLHLKGYIPDFARGN